MIAPRVQMRSGFVWVLIGALNARCPVDISRTWGIDSGMQRATFLAWVHVPSTITMLNPVWRAINGQRGQHVPKTATNLQQRDHERDVKGQMSLIILERARPKMQSSWAPKWWWNERTEKRQTYLAPSSCKIINQCKKFGGKLRELLAAAHICITWESWLGIPFTKTLMLLSSRQTWGRAPVLLEREYSLKCLTQEWKDVERS